MDIKSIVHAAADEARVPRAETGKGGIITRDGGLEELFFIGGRMYEKDGAVGEDKLVRNLKMMEESSGERSTSGTAKDGFVAQSVEVSCKDIWRESPMVEQGGVGGRCSSSGSVYRWGGTSGSWRSGLRSKARNNCIGETSLQTLNSSMEVGSGKGCSRNAGGGLVVRGFSEADEVPVEVCQWSLGSIEVDMHDVDFEFNGGEIEGDGLAEGEFKIRFGKRAASVQGWEKDGDGTVMNDIGDAVRIKGMGSGSRNNDGVNKKSVDEIADVIGGTDMAFGRGVVDKEGCIRRHVASVAVVEKLVSISVDRVFAELEKVIDNRRKIRHCF